MEELRHLAHEFAVNLMLRLGDVLPSGDLGLTCEAATSRGESRMAIGTSMPGGIVLTIEGEPRLQLQIDYKLTMSRTSQRLAVESSTYLVRPFGVPRPLFSVDYVRNAGSNIPAAHYNFHFEHAEVAKQLLEAGRRRRGKIHRREGGRGRSPQLADVHFPVGGHRFRPCLEDVLELLWVEFGVDTRPGAQGAIHEGRMEWRSKQLSAAVADDPIVAAAELRRLGFTVEAPARDLSARFDRVSAL